MRKQKVSKSKRLWVTLISMGVNVTLFYIGINLGIDPIALGTGIGMINAPVYAYLGMESWKPSKKKTNEEM